MLGGMKHGFPHTPETLVFSLILSIIFNKYLPILRFIYFPFTLLCLPFLLVALVIIFVCWGDFSKQKTTIIPGKRPQSLITTGIYAYSRNPLYLSVVFILLGCSIFLGSLSGFLGPVIYVVIANWHIIPYEEKLVEETFGKTYLDYKKRVPRWLLIW